MMCKHLQYFNEHALDYEAYSFEKIMSEYLEMNEYQEDKVLYILNEIWSDRKYLIGNIRYENIIIATCIFVKFKTQDLFCDAFDIVPDMYSDNYKMHALQIYEVYESLKGFFTTV